MCYCKKCGFSWYDRRLSNEEETKLYCGYRSEEYQLMREKYEPEYTKELNYLLGHDDDDLKQKQKLLTQILKKWDVLPIQNALDYGGDLGQRYPTDIPIKNKYVYDISGIKPLDGIINIPTYENAGNINFDFIMCNHTLEHVGDLDMFISLVSSLGRKGTWFYFEVPFDSPFYPHTQLHTPISILKTYLWRMKIYANILLPKLIPRRFRITYEMHEHINFFTPKSIQNFLERNGFEIYDNKTKVTKGKALGITYVVSILCKKK